MIHKFLGLLILVLAGLAGSCSEKEPLPADSASSAKLDSQPTSGNDLSPPEAGYEPNKIAWHDGNIESAFAEAKQSERPVFLYWGAEWCPPCNQLKATLFKDPDFVAKTRLFVPVYLDGDTERAQIYGEQYGISGYPTLVVLSAENKELTRIPGGMDLQRYAEVLDWVLQEQKPVSHIVESFQNGQELSAKEFKILALYSWGQDRGQVLKEGEEEGVLYALYQACPTELALAKSRLFSAWWYALKTTELKQEAYVLADEKKQILLTESKNILSNDELIYNNLDFVLYDRGALLPLLGEKQQKYIALWYAALEKISSNSALPLLAQLTPTRTKIYLENPGKDVDEFSVSAELKQEIIATVERTRKSKLKSYEHSVVMNLFWYMLTSAGLYEDADRIFKEELANSDSPYYFMVDVALSAQELGRKEEALEWLQRAYEEAKEGATKFQWGVIYLEGVVEMFPEEKTLVVETALDVLSQLENREDAFFNRNQLRARRVEKALVEWNQQSEFNESIQTIATFVSQLCQNWATPDEGENQAKGENYQRCGVLLEALQSSTR